MERISRPAPVDAPVQRSKQHSSHARAFSKRRATSCVRVTRAYVAIHAVVPTRRVSPRVLVKLDPIS
jgi:hypothetical protein